MPLPNFTSPSTAQLRLLWRSYHGIPDVERLILEVHRLQEAMREIEGLYGAIERAWKDEKLGHLVALHKLRLMMMDERSRHGSLRGLE